MCAFLFLGCEVELSRRFPLKSGLSSGGDLNLDPNCFLNKWAFLPILVTMGEVFAYVGSIQDMKKRNLKELLMKVSGRSGAHRDIKNQKPQKSDTRNIWAIP